MNAFKFPLFTLCITIFAGATLALADTETIEEDTLFNAKLTGRLQSLVLLNDDDFKPDDSIEFRIRRARLRLALDLTTDISLVFQSEFLNVGSIKGDVDLVEEDLIDAYIKYKPDPWVQLIAGINMAPVQRQTLTSAGAMMAFDRPGITNYNLTWGMKGNTGLQTGTVPGTKISTFGENQVRDRGITLFGSGEFSKDHHLKYYLSSNNGSRYSDDTNRQSFRLQWNHGDAEPGYYNKSSYLGQKETLGLGFALDQQDGIALDAVTLEPVDYELLSVDAFLEKPWDDGYLTIEAAYTQLDLNDTANPLANYQFEPLSSTPASQTQGKGFYIQAGYLVDKFQPWILVETWQTDDVLDNGSWQSVRLGFTYYVDYKKTNIKVGVERTQTDGVNATDITTAALGVYMTF